jgi:hypothetical protein
LLRRRRRNTCAGEKTIWRQNRRPCRENNLDTFRGAEEAARQELLKACALISTPAMTESSGVAGPEPGALVP